MTHMPGDGARIARLFRMARGLQDVRACDLDALAEDDDIEICEFDCRDPGCTAVLLRAPDCKAGIMLAPGQIRGRRRFSIGHEFGHYHMPKHHATTYFKCTEADMRTRAGDTARLEWEANEFAAELLMPRNLFSADAAKRDLSFETVHHLAAKEMYDVSVTAAAWRLVQVSREPCALVATWAGRVEWVARSASFRLPLIEKRQPLSPDSIAAAVRRGDVLSGGSESVPWYAWFDGTSTEHVQLLESAHSIPSLDQVLSLLWVIEADPEDDC